MSKNKVICIVLFLLVVAGFYYYFFFLRFPLPKDDKMIKHFHKHRADFEEVVRRYQNYERSRDKDSSFWYREGDTQEIFDRVGIRRITTQGSVWLENPYSIETANAVRDAISENKFFYLRYLYSALMISPSPKEDFYLGHMRYINIWKDYYYFPQIPRIEEEQLLGPLREDGEYSFKDRALNSLNSFPDNWQRFECVYRSIDKQWFIRLCNGH